MFTCHIKLYVCVAFTGYKQLTISSRVKYRRELNGDYTNHFRVFIVDTSVSECFTYHVVKLFIITLYVDV